MYVILPLLSLFLAVGAQWGSTNSGSCHTPDQQPGFCLVVTFCKTMTDFLAKIPKPPSAEIRQKLKEYQCGVTSNKKPKVCCPSKPILLDKSDGGNDNQSGSNSNGLLPDVSTHKNLDLLPKNCGHLDTVDKIVNGNMTGLFEFPWMALLSYQTRTGPSFRCGGTIINKNFILTAAHCVTNLGPLKLIGVRVGEHNIKTQIDCEEDHGEEICAPPYQDLSIERVITHEKYSVKTHVNDIALIRVSSINLELENSRPVCLPLEAARNFNFTNRNVVVTGWGATETGNSSPVLLKVEFPVVPLQQCQEKYNKLYKLVPTQICAGGGKSDSCGGDSGGPLHALAALHGEPRFVQQGIVSFGPKDCGNAAIPGVYTRVASYMDWILDKLYS